MACRQGTGTNDIESELFGHERGAFAGAQTRQQGRFEVADGTSIFLDEIGELPLELQAKLLQVLEEGAFERLGSSHTIKVDVRVIAVTNRDLEEEVRKGRCKDHIVGVLQSTNWRIDDAKGAALILGLNPSTLRSRMRKLGIRKP
ncbi:sigma-54 interaction domain protein [delta proteobacterium NaphS2]|nr:sigma-54 interaction domain protein [delta proteobacterium NaphS2]